MTNVSDIRKALVATGCVVGLPYWLVFVTMVCVKVRQGKSLIRAIAETLAELPIVRAI